MIAQDPKFVFRLCPPVLRREKRSRGVGKDLKRATIATGNKAVYYWSLRTTTISYHIVPTREKNEADHIYHIVSTKSYNYHIGLKRERSEADH